MVNDKNQDGHSRGFPSSANSADANQGQARGPAAFQGLPTPHGMCTRVCAHVCVCVFKRACTYMQHPYINTLELETLPLYGALELLPALSASLRLDVRGTVTARCISAVQSCLLCEVPKWHPLPGGASHVHLVCANGDTLLWQGQGQGKEEGGLC